MNPNQFGRIPPLPPLASFPVEEIEAELAEDTFEGDKRRVLAQFKEDKHMEDVESVLQLLEEKGEGAIDARVFQDPDVQAAAVIVCMDLVNFFEAYHGVLGPDEELKTVARFRALFKLPRVLPDLTLIKKRASAEVVELLQNPNLPPRDRLKYNLLVEAWLRAHPGKVIEWDTPVEGLPEIARPSIERKIADPDDKPGDVQAIAAGSGPKRKVKHTVIKGETLEGAPVSKKGLKGSGYEVPPDEVERFDRAALLSELGKKDSSQQREAFSREEVEALRRKLNELPS